MTAEVPAARECAAFPRFVRVAAVLLMLALAVGAIVTAAELHSAAWTIQGVLLIGLAYLCIAWMGYWILNSRTRLEGERLVQTWLWTKRASAADVAHMKLVHWPWLEALIAPRLLIRQRNGAIVWIHAADAQLLRDFMAQVAVRRVAALTA